MVTILRLAVVAAVLFLLLRSARMAWRHRRLAGAVWRRIRPRHVLGALGLLTIVVTVAFTLMAFVPVTRYGAGTPLGLHGNAIFAPIEEAQTRANDGAPVVAPDGTPTEAAFDPGVLIAVGTTGFLVLLLLLFPYLAYVEERVFREGLEEATLPAQAWAALKFGLLHMIMLIPLGAALAVAVAGFAYGRIYRRAYERSAARTETVAGPFGVPVVVAPPRQQVRSEAVLASTVWHTTFNSLIVVLVLLGFAYDWLR